MQKQLIYFLGCVISISTLFLLKSKWQASVQAVPERLIHLISVSKLGIKGP